ncbi:MAG: hypothetical protein LBQ73_11300 [Tannerellaceae bacterium]|jgi:hypothetical protein|nr:hypothetical protein [Tannerellaceae bacterium]
MNPRTAILAICVLAFLFVNFDERRENSFEVISMHNATYAVKSEYLLPDVGKVNDTITVVFIKDGETKRIDKYVFVESTIRKNDE